jgi:hypothetical protein
MPPAWLDSLPQFAIRTSVAGHRVARKNSSRKHIMSTEITSHPHAQFQHAYFTRAAHELQAGLPQGPVRIRYSSQQWNEVLKRQEPVYACYRTSGDSDSLGTWYKNALERFSK